MAEPVAFVHDYLTQRGGAERVVATWCHAFPTAPLYTSVYDPAATFSDFTKHQVITSRLNHIATLRSRHRLAMPLLAPTFSHWRVDADVVVASSSGWAHGVRTDGRLLVYCHAPARWLYQRDLYLGADHFGVVARATTACLNPSLARWDARAAKRADVYLANSTHTRDAIRRIYGRDAEVLAPPIVGPSVMPANDDRTDVLVVSRLLAYKNVDVVLEVARQLPQTRFVVVGDGPLRASLTAAAPRNVALVGAVSDEDLWTYYAGARVFLALSYEDFGLAPLEAALAGVPSVARAFGGYLDTITEETGLFVSDTDDNADAVARVVATALSRSWDREALRAHAATYSATRHVARLKELIAER